MRHYFFALFAGSSTLEKRAAAALCRASIRQAAAAESRPEASGYIRCRLFEDILAVSFYPLACLGWTHAFCKCAFINDLACLRENRCDPSELTRCAEPRECRTQHMRNRCASSNPRTSDGCSHVIELDRRRGEPSTIQSCIGTSASR